MAGRLNHGVKHMLPNLIAKSSNRCWVETECGRKFLDFTCGIGVTNLGHCHPKVTVAAQQAVTHLVHAQQNIMRHRPMIDLIGKLSDLDFSKKAGLDSWFFWNSGAEAVEASIKLARQATGKPNIVVVNGGYHGRTFGAMALTTSGTIYRSGFGPLMSGVNVVPFPYLTQGPFSTPSMRKHWPKQCLDKGYNYWGAAPADVATMDTDRCLDALELLLRTQSSPAETAAIIVEPVLGEGGYVPCPPGYLQGLRKICDKHGILLIADEVQTGFGRTGKMFACEWVDGGVTPDIVVCAKGLGNGFPISAIASRSDLTIKQPPGSMGGTYGANALSCAAAGAVLDAFHQENVLANVETRELELRHRLAQLQTLVPGFVREVRGKGLMIGVEFEAIVGLAPGYTAGAVVAACIKRDLLMLSCGPFETLRMIPPLNITSAELQDAMTRFTEAVVEVALANSLTVKQPAMAHA